MQKLFHQLVHSKAKLSPNAFCLQFKEQRISYLELQKSIEVLSTYFLSIGLEKQDRVAIYLGKNIESIISFFAISSSGGIFVPINPYLKKRQVTHILSDCTPSILITSSSRLEQLQLSLEQKLSIKHIILIKKNHIFSLKNERDSSKIHLWENLLWQEKVNHKAFTKTEQTLNIKDNDTVAILYTSGSTGQAKGVMISHNNLFYGAKSVSSYLNNTAKDKILAVLPFSFDYGLSQITTAFYSGACVVLLEYLLPRDVIKAIEKYQITGLAAVPPLWNQLAKLTWPEKAKQSLRYITSSGGVLNKKVLQQLKQHLPNTLPFLMYGLTEAFRSTFLEPSFLDKKHLDKYSTSIGKAIPHAKILIINKKGKLCKADEEGELVHLGPLVANGYWNNRKATAKVFRPISLSLTDHSPTELAVWSGDIVKKDVDGFIYFIERNDEMIKSSGFRISPTEIEALFVDHKEILNAIAIGIADTEIGQSITLICTTNSDISVDDIKKFAKQSLPSFMCPRDVIIKDALPLTANGKIDRQSLKKEYEKTV